MRASREIDKRRRWRLRVYVLDEPSHHIARERAHGNLTQGLGVRGLRRRRIKHGQIHPDLRICFQVLDQPLDEVLAAPSADFQNHKARQPIKRTN
jgi:hypothetical protein